MDFPNSETSVLCHEKTRFYPLISARAMISSAVIGSHWRHCIRCNYRPIRRAHRPHTGGKKWANFTALYLFNKATNFDEFFFVGLEILWTLQNKKLEYNLTSQRWEVSVLVQTIRFFAEKWIHKNEAGSPETEWIQKILFLSERIHQSTRYKLQTAARIVKYGIFGTLF